MHRSWRAWFTFLAVLTLLGPLRAEPGTATLSGRVIDPSGLSVPGVTVMLVEVATGNSRTAVSDRSGAFKLIDLTPGTYRLESSYAGFAPFSTTVTVDGERTQHADVRLQIETVKETVTIWAPVAESYIPLASSRQEVSDSERAWSRNSAELLSNTPGVELQQAGVVAPIPMLHGLGDERTRLIVNGMTISAACPNHMNPPLSYIDPSNVAKTTVIAGITPASTGGDSIGGTVEVESPQPAFTKNSGEVHAEGAISSFYRSNGTGYGAALSAAVATRHVSFGYSGSWSNTEDYSDGSGQTVTSTYGQTTNHTVHLAAQGAGNLVGIEAGLHNTPYQGFPNQQMDMTRNHGDFVNVRYNRNLRRGTFESQAYWQDVRHEMNVGKDKSTFPMPMWMPMDTHGQDLGYSIRFQVPLSERHSLLVGNQFHRFTLDDRWPAVPGADPWMGPNEFVSINNGHRLRLGWFGELNSKWNSRWTTTLGVRNDTVWSDTGPVSGYSDTPMYTPDAEAFNAQSHARTDVNFELTALARYKANRAVSFEVGYARKTRSPNPYERYAWSTNWMASGMINWFGDGNYYVGNLQLRPEISNTVSGTVSVHDPAGQRWELELTPHWMYIQDYIGVDRLATATYGESTFAQLQFANQNGRIYGLDLSGKATLWNSVAFGRGEIHGVAGWLHGTVITSGEGMYHIMPPNVRLSLDETLKAWTGAAELELVDRKSQVDALRYEPTTAGYALLNLRLGYRWRRLGVEIGVHNVFDKFYYLPLGGVNFDAYMQSGWAAQIMPLSGPGRSFYTGVAVRF